MFMELVQDTNVFIAALRSQEGASAEVLDRCLAQKEQAIMTRQKRGNPERGRKLLAEIRQRIASTPKV